MADEYLNKNGRPDKSPEGTTASASPVERTPLPDSAVPPQDYQQAQYSYVPPQPEPQEEPKPSRSWWKVLAGLFAGCLVLNLVLGILGVIAFSLMTASCVSCMRDWRYVEAQSRKYVAAFGTYQRSAYQAPALAASWPGVCGRAVLSATLGSPSLACSKKGVGI